MAKRRAGSLMLNTDDLSTEAGTAFLELLERVTIDGALSDEEIQELRAWLAGSATTIPTVPGAQFLREEVAGVLADGTISPGERKLLQGAVLRVLPTTQRARAKVRIADATAKVRTETRARAFAEQEEADQWATPNQIAYIRDLGSTCPDGATRADASRLIEQLLATRPTTRQRMVLRFWDRPDLLSAGVDGVSAWMDQWYAEDPRRLEAWELWKRETVGSNARTGGAIELVPVGAGNQYLARLEMSTAPSPASPVAASARSTPKHVLIGLGLAVGSLSLLGWCGRLLVGP